MAWIFSQYIHNYLPDLYINAIHDVHRHLIYNQNYTNKPYISLSFLYEVFISLQESLFEGVLQVVVEGLLSDDITACMRGSIVGCVHPTMPIKHTKEGVTRHILQNIHKYKIISESIVWSSTETNWTLLVWEQWTNNGYTMPPTAMSHWQHG